MGHLCGCFPPGEGQQNRGSRTLGPSPGQLPRPEGSRTERGGGLWSLRVCDAARAPLSAETLSRKSTLTELLSGRP